jgi:hypothetical protein
MAPRMLPNEMSQAALTPRLLSGDLDVWYGFTQPTTQAIAANAVTVWLMNETVWLSWGSGGLGAGAVEVDVAKANIAGDVSWRTFFCGTDAPRFTDLGLATGLTFAGNPVTGSATLGPAYPSGGPYPIYSRKLGVPNPFGAAAAPSASPGQPPAATQPLTILETFDNPTGWNLAPNTANTGGNFVITGGHPGACMHVQAIGGIEAVDWKLFSIDYTFPITFDVDLYHEAAYNFFINPGFLDIFVGCDSGLSGTVCRITYSTLPDGIYVGWYAANAGVVGAAIAAPTFIPYTSISGYYHTGDNRYWSPWGPNKWFHATITVTPSGTPITTANYTANFYVGWTSPASPGTLLFSSNISGFTAPLAGSAYGVGVLAPVSGYPNWSSLRIDNFQLAGTGPATTPAAASSTTYLYTLVNDLGQESGPSPAMLNSNGTTTISRVPGQSVVVSLPGGATPYIALTAMGVDPTYFEGGASGYIPSTQLNVTPTVTNPSINLYRAVTGSTGTSFFLVASGIPLGGNVTVSSSGVLTVNSTGNATTTITDLMLDASLTFALQTLNWAPPPTNMLGIIPLPNGIYAGFTSNQLCLSVQGVPHAWPLIYRLAFDFPVVGMGHIDSTVVALTQFFPYLAFGSTPDAYTQTKVSYPYACVSKKSIQFMQNIGVIFASTMGLVAIASPGQEIVLTKDLFTRREWAALNPPSMIGAVHDNRYFCWYTDLTGAPGGFYIDLQQQMPYPGVPNMNAGKVSLNVYATVKYLDPNGNLYLILQQASSGYAVAAGGFIIYNEAPVNTVDFYNFTNSTSAPGHSLSTFTATYAAAGNTVEGIFVAGGGFTYKYIWAGQVVSPGSVLGFAPSNIGFGLAPYGIFATSSLSLTTTVVYTYAGDTVAAGVNINVPWTNASSVNNATEAIVGAGAIAGTLSAATSKYLFAGSAWGVGTNLSIAPNNDPVCAASNATRGIFYIGNPYPTGRNTSKYVYSGDVVTTGTNMITTSYYAGACGNSSFGYKAGGYNGSPDTAAAENYNFDSDIVTVGVSLSQGRSNFVMLSTVPSW